MEELSEIEKMIEEFEKQDSAFEIPVKEEKEEIIPKTKEISTKTFLKFDSETEEKLIVGYFYKDRSTFLKLAQYLVTNNWKKNSYFNDKKLQFIMNACYRYSEKYKKMPQEDVVYAMIEKSDMDEYLKEQAKKLFKELKEKDYSGYSDDYIKDVAISFIKKERAVEATYMCQAEIQAGNFENLSKIMLDAVNVNLDKDLGLSIKDVTTAFSLVKEVHDETQGCCWGSQSLDERVGRLQKGEIAVFAGVPGAGKTAWLGHLGISNMKENKKVAIFSFEVDKKRLSTRLYKSLFKVDTQQLLSMEETEAYKILSSTEGDIKIICRKANSTSSNDMASILKDLETYEGWKPDLILIDYILIASTNDKRKDSTESYKYYKTVTEEMRNLGVEFNCPVVTAVQLNREAMGKDGGSKAVVTSKDISESRGVLDTADYTIMIEQTVAEKYIDDSKNSGVYRLRVDKNRNGESGFQVGFDIDWRTLSIEENPEILKRKK